MRERVSESVQTLLILLLVGSWSSVGCLLLLLLLLLYGSAGGQSSTRLGRLHFNLGEGEREIGRKEGGLKGGRV